MSELSDSSTSPGSIVSSTSASNGKKRVRNTSKMSLSPCHMSSTPSPMVDEDSVSMKRGRKESEQRRRVLMNQYFDEMIILLSMISERKIPKKMDKASILHEAVKCMRTYSDLTVMTKPKSKPKGKGGAKSKEVKLRGMCPDIISIGDVLHFFLDAHDTFLILISESGHILYATELVTSLLGHMQTRLVGQNIFDYILESDKSVLLNMFNPHNAKPITLQPDSHVLAYPSRSFKCHFSMYSGETCTLPQHLPFMCLSYLRHWNKTELPASPPLSPSESGDTDPVPPSGNTSQHQACVLLGKLPTHLTFLDLPVGVNDVNFTFDMRISKEGNIINIDTHAVLLLGYTVSELVGSRFFDYINPYHLTEVGDHMAEFFNNGRGTTNPYRFFTKGGRYIWLLSKGYLSYNPWNHKPDHILLYNRILGCDHVLPEYRFFRSRTFLPDLDGEELYNPPPLQSNMQSELVQQQPLLVQQHPQHQSWQPATPMQGIQPGTPMQGIQAGTPMQGVQAGTPMQGVQPGTPMQGVQSYPQTQAVPSTGNYVPLLPLSSSQIGSPATPPVQPGHLPGHLKSEASASVSEGECRRGSVGSVMTPEQRLGTELRRGSSMLNLQSSLNPNPDVNMNSNLNSNLGVNLPTSSNPNSGVKPNLGGNLQTSSNPNFMVDFQHEIEKKNQELFTMQRRLLEQQMLMEQERNQFYQVAQQVMHYIGSNSAMSIAPTLPSNLQLSCLTSQANNQSHRPLKPPSNSSAGHSSESVTFSPAATQAYQNSPCSTEMSPYSQLQNRLTASRKSVGNSPFATLQSHRGIGGLAQSATMAPPPTSSNGVSSSHTANNMLSSWAGMVQKPNLSHRQEQPGQSQENGFQQQMQSKPPEHYHQHQHTRPQQLQSSLSGSFPAPPQLSGLNLPQVPQGGINLPQVPNFFPQNPVTSAASFSSLPTFQSPTPFQTFSSQLQLSSLPSHPSLQNLSSASIPSSTQASDLPQQSEFSSGTHMRLPNDEEIQNLLDAIQMKCASIPTSSSASFPS